MRERNAEWSRIQVKIEVVTTLSIAFFLFDGAFVFIEMTILVDWVDVSLVDVHKEDQIVAKTAQSMHCGHFNDECEEIVDKRVESSIH